MPDTSQNITFDLIRHAQEQPTATALIRAGHDVSYRELDIMVWRVAQYLHDEGVKANHVIALSLKSEFFLSLSILALTRLGATTLTVRQSATPHEIRQWLDVAHPRFVLSDHAMHPAMHALPAISFSPDRMNTIGQVQFNILCENPSSALAIHAGSGSTGQAKLIPLTHEQMRQRLKLRQASGMLSQTSRVFKPSSLAFTSSQTQLLQTLHEGAAYCLNEQPGASLEDQLTACRADVASLSVFHAENWLATTARTAPHPALKQVRMGASSISMALRQTLRERLCENLWVGYGTNETGLICLATPPSVYSLNGTVGAPIPGVALSIVDNAGQVLPFGQVGHIRVKSPGCISQYLGCTDDTPKPSLPGTNFQESTFYPGDTGYLTESGELIHMGRSDQMMIFNGINIYPAEIELCLSQHPAVRGVVGFPLTSKVHQDVPVCAVELNDPSVTAEALQSFAQAHLGFKAPRQVFVVPHIPRTETGKLIRAELFKLISTSGN